MQTTRKRIRVVGTVQGVGFRPWVYHKARALGLQGEVCNRIDGLVIEIEGEALDCARFEEVLSASPPPHADIQSIDVKNIPVQDSTQFQIVEESLEKGSSESATGVLPDLATCADCLLEMRDPANRRYRYPFINCTQCGPRYTIIERLPYDRPHTSMAAFELCAACQGEYTDPTNRRFHAQPIACPDCGPQLSWHDGEGIPSADGQEAFNRMIELVTTGGIVALKGLGGFHLICDARNEAAIQRLRQRKGRPRKPLALLCRDIHQVEDLAELDKRERELIRSPAAPIVLLRKKVPSAIAVNCAPDINCWGIMLPSHPLLHLLMQAIDFPLVATSGNRSEEPLCYENEEALHDLRGIADGFLLHDRPIRHPIDDSIVRVIHQQAVCMRNARGYALQTFRAPHADRPRLALGGRQKNALAFQHGSTCILGPHIGSLNSLKGFRRFELAARELPRLYGETKPELVCDRHPDDEAAVFARNAKLPLMDVQHHHAHVVSCMVEYQLHDEVLGFSWDGTGYGDDGSIWGGECITATRSSFKRRAHLRPFPLPGAEAAIHSPARCAFGLLHAAGLEPPEDLQLAANERLVIQQMLDQGINCPMTSSAGRLFDAVAGLLGICPEVSYEGEAAMRLESCIEAHDTHFALADDPLDWAPPIRALLEAQDAGRSIGWLATAFHNTLVQMILATAQAWARPAVVLSGGCFQNAYLCERSAQALEAAGFTVYLHGRVPPNDGGLALGQLAIAHAIQSRNPSCA